MFMDEKLFILVIFNIIISNIIIFNITKGDTMVECDVTTRKWGNSLGITLPKEIVEEAHLKENEEIKILILKKSQTAEHLFGMFKGKISGSGQEIKDMIRNELHHG